MSVWNRTAPAGSAPLILVNEITPDKPRVQALVGGAASPRIARASALAETRGGHGASAKHGSARQQTDLA